MSYNTTPSPYQHGSPPQQQPPADVVTVEQYRNALYNFGLAHKVVERQRAQLEEQERVVAELKARIALLEGGTGATVRGPGGNTIDDFSIRNTASQLDKMINRWAADIVRAPPAPLGQMCAAILSDVVNGLEVEHFEATPMELQAYLRHALSEAISEGIINCLIVTNSMESNAQLSRIHEHLFARDPTVACVWRRQTFTAAVESCTPQMSMDILYEHIPQTMTILQGKLPLSGGVSILDSAYAFSRMLHGAGSTTNDSFYRAFVPELGSTTVDPREIELVRRCIKNERGEFDRMGATMFPGLVKVSKSNGQEGQNTQTLVRRAQVICECALRGTSIPASPPMHLPAFAGGMMHDPSSGPM